MEKTEAKKPSTVRRLLFCAGVLVIVLAAAIGSYVFLYFDKIVPGVKVNGIAVGGLTAEEARARIAAAVAIFENTGLSFTNGQRTVHVESVIVSPTDPDLNYRLVNFNIDEAVSVAYGVGREGNYFERFAQAAAALAVGRPLPFSSSLDREHFIAALREIWKSDEQPTVGAGIKITMNGNVFVKAETIPEVNGMEYDLEAAVDVAAERLEHLDPAVITLSIKTAKPSIVAAQAEAALALVPRALAIAPLTLVAEDKKTVLSAAMIAPLLEPYLDAVGQPSLRLNRDETAAALEDLIVAYDIKPSDTRFEIDPATQKMTAFEQGRDGRKIDVDKTIDLIRAELASRLAADASAKKIVVLTAELKSKVITKSAADLGIQEVIGIGRSDFSGSTSNRIKNIKHGSSKLNGRLIAPDEEFSLVQALEPVTLEDGYFQEQIILGDKIQPAVGGGLCQIGTTTFRAAMNSGLPIIERQNHSLVVHYYYDPANGNPGTDATIYGPHPDLRFKNDTGHWILFTTDINTVTKDLVYTFWGTPDGRHGSYSPPQVIRWISAPAEVRMTETTDLEPGVEKCQNAFTGADTTFKYTIVKPDGTVTQRDFPSHYRAIPKICMVGAAAPAVPETPADGTTPPVDVNANTNANIPVSDLPPEAAVGN